MNRACLVLIATREGPLVPVSIHCQIESRWGGPKWEFLGQNLTFSNDQKKFSFSNFSKQSPLPSTFIQSICQAITLVWDAWWWNWNSFEKMCSNHQIRSRSPRNRETSFKKCPKLIYLKMTAFASLSTYSNPTKVKFKIFCKHPWDSRFWNINFILWRKYFFVHKKSEKKFSVQNCLNFQENRLMMAYDDISCGLAA